MIKAIGLIKEFFAIERELRNLTSNSRIKEELSEVSGDWLERIDRVLMSPVNRNLVRYEGAGTISEGIILMHNGVRIAALSYYGGGMIHLLQRNKGSHEPEEELIFEQVARVLGESPVMLELGAYWGFYSLSLLNRRPKARCILVEPDKKNLLAGMVNFRINRRKGIFVNAYAGEKIDSFPESVPVLQVDEYLEINSIKDLDILHSDIQGGEAAMLHSASNTLKNKRVRFVFISTHWDQMHAECHQIIEDHGYEIRCDILPSSSYSYDGLIFASRDKGSSTIKIQ